MELGRFLSRFRPLVPVHAVFDLEFLTLFLLYLTVRWTPLLGDLLAIGFFPVHPYYLPLGRAPVPPGRRGCRRPVGAPLPAGPPPTGPVQPGGLRPAVPPRHFGPLGLLLLALKAAAIWYGVRRPLQPSEEGA